MAFVFQKSIVFKLLVHKLHELRARNAIVKKIEPYLQSEDRILDIGSGTGHTCRNLLERGYDVSPLDVRDLSLFDDVTPTLYDGKKIPFNDDSFDVALILTVLHHTYNPVVIIEEAKRVSKKIIIIEDVYSNFVSKYLTFFFDSIGNMDIVHHPHSNKTDEQWRNLFALLKLKLLDAKKAYSMPVFTHATYFLEK